MEFLIISSGSRYNDTKAPDRKALKPQGIGRFRLKGKGIYMSDVSRLIRERAMAILRDTRAKIDPALLAALKERIGEVMPQAAAMASSPGPQMTQKQHAPVEEKFIPPVMETHVAPLPSTAGEPVDKQKIAQIVLSYMKHRENGQKH